MPRDGAGPLDATEDSVEAKQDTHDDLNANANLQVNDIDVSDSNRVPTKLESEFDEDSPHITGDKGVQILVVRNDTEGPLAGADGDYATLQLDAFGRLRIVFPVLAETVQEFEGSNAATDKINYTVTASKVLFIQHWHVAFSEGDKYLILLRVDGIAVSSIGGGEGKTGGGDQLFPDNNPLGPYAAGASIDLFREEGDSGKDWSGGVIGFEKDA